MRYRRQRYGRTAPVEPGTGPDNGGGGGAPNQPADPATPSAFDPSTLSPEAKAYVEAQLKAERDKARGFERAAGAKEERSKVTTELAKALGLAPAEADPQKIAAELAAAQEANKLLKVEGAAERAARKLGADDDLVVAKLHRDGVLKGLDPDAPDFADKVKAAVEKVVADNPRLKLDGAPTVTPPAGKAPVAQAAGGNGAGEGSRRPGLGPAIGNSYKK